MRIKILSIITILLVLINGLFLAEIFIRYEEDKTYYVVNKNFLINEGYYCELKYVTDGVTKLETVDLMLFYNIKERSKYRVKEYRTPLGRVINRKIELSCDSYYPF